MVLAVGRLSVRVQANLGIIRGGVARGLSSTQIQGLVRQTGQLGLRRSDLLAGMRHARGIAEAGLNINNIRMDFFPDPSRLEPSRTRMLSKFSFEVRYAPPGWREGDPGARYITVRKDENLTHQQILDEAEQARQEAGGEKDSGGISDDLEVTISGAKIRS